MIKEKSDKTVSDKEDFNLLNLLRVKRNRFAAHCHPTHGEIFSKSY